MQQTDILIGMRNELLGSQLRVSLAPAREPQHTDHSIRVVESQNPWWYQDLCARYPSSRKDNRLGTRLQRTRVNRKHILQLLARLGRGEEVQSIYALELLALADSVLETWRNEEEERYGQ